MLLDLQRLLELAGIREDCPTTGADTLSRQEASRIFARHGQPVLHGDDDPRTAWLKLLGIHEGVSRLDPQVQRLVQLAGLYHLYEFGTLDKLRTLRDHPNTSPEEKAAAQAAIDRIQPPKPPPPKAPDGGYVNKGKVFSAGPETDDATPQPRAYTTARGKTFA